MNFLKLLDKILAKIAIFFIWIYQLTISPDKGVLRFLYSQKVCLHTPHCSEYGRQCYAKHGFIKGTEYTMNRVASCKPSNPPKYDPSSFRVVFFCAAPIGVNFLTELEKDSRFDVCGVVTAPDKPINRGQKVAPNVIKKTALDLGIEDIQTPEKINSEKSEEGKEFTDWLKSKEADFFVVIAYGKIVPQAILDIPKISPINIHGSILPEYRGASPIQSVLLDGKEETGITIMKMDAKMDTGDMIKIMKFKIEPDWTVWEVIEKMVTDGPKFFVDGLWEFGKGDIKAVKQDDSKATYCGKFTKEDGLVDWNKPAQDIYNRFRALKMWPGTYTYFDGKKLSIELCEVGVGEGEGEGVGVVFKKGEEVFVSCGVGCLKLVEVKLEGKKVQSVRDFVNGHSNFIGFRF